MTSQHFEALAAELRRKHPDVVEVSPTSGERLAWKRCMLAVAEVCKEFNPAFDLNRFEAACTPTKEK